MWVERFSAVPDPDQKTGADSAIIVSDKDGALLESALHGEHLLHLEGASIGAAFRGNTKLNLQHVGDTAPRRIIILVHGFEFEPRVGWQEHEFDQPNPHHAIFHNRPEVSRLRERRCHNTPWLTRLDLQDGDLVIPFGYSSDPGRISVDLPDDHWVTEVRRQLRRLNRKRQHGAGLVDLFGHAYAKAGQYGIGLAALIAMLVAHWPGRDGPPVHIVGHSLGARVVTRALEELARRPEGAPALDRIGRVILLASALAPHQVQNFAAAYRMTKLKGQGPEVYNFTSASDRVLYWIGARLAYSIAENLAGEAASRSFLQAYFRKLRRPSVIGLDGGEAWASPLRWIDIPLDHAQTRSWGMTQGIGLGGDYRFCKMDHWVHFTHAPNWQLYRHILSGDPTWSADAIRTGRMPDGAVLRPPLRARSGGKYKIVQV